MKHFSVQDWCVLVQTIVMLGSLPVAAYELYEQAHFAQETDRVASADFVLKIAAKIEDTSNDRVLSAIEENPSNHSLLDDQAMPDKITRNDIEAYIGNFETLGDLTRDHLIDPAMAYDEVGYDIEKAWCNSDVQTIIMDDRKADGAVAGADTFYNGFESLAHYSLVRGHKTCEAMDKL